MPILLYTSDMNAEGTGATFNELSAWAQLAALSLAYLAVLLISSQDPLNAVRLAVACTGALVVLILVMVATHTVLASATKAEPDDERDRAIRLRASRFGDLLHGFGVITAFLVLLVQQILLGEDTSTRFTLHPLFAGHLLLFTLFVAEFFRLVQQVVGYRRG